MSRIAFTTFAVLKQPYGDPEVEGFENLLPPTLEEAERSQGFIAHPVEDQGQGHLSVFDRQWGAWGKFEVPRFYTGQRTNETLSFASTLSLWEDLESVFSLFTAGFTGLRCREDMNGFSSLNGRRTLRGGSLPAPCRPGVTLAVHLSTCMITDPLLRRSRFIRSLRTGPRCDCLAASRAAEDRAPAGRPGTSRARVDQGCQRIVPAVCGPDTLGSRPVSTKRRAISASFMFSA
jgi:hypothetical protein